MGLVPRCAGTEVPDAAEITASSQSRGSRGNVATPGRDPRHVSVRPAPLSEALSVPPGPFEIRPRPASPSGVSGEQPANRLPGGPGVVTPVWPSLGSAPRRRVALRAERPPPFPWQGGSFQSPRRDPQFVGPRATRHRRNRFGVLQALHRLGSARRPSRAQCRSPRLRAGSVGALARSGEHTFALTSPAC